MAAGAGPRRWVTAGWLALAASHAAAGPVKVGLAEMQFVDRERERPLATRLWYPAADDAQEQDLAYDRAFLGRAAPGAAFLAGTPRPLILLSHGDRGSNANQAWLAEALAAQGYVVAAVAHWKNTTRDHVPEETVRVWERPRDLSFVASALLADPQWGARLDGTRLGAAGHSSGGYAVLALAGARYSPLRMGAYCSSADAGPDCALAKGVDFSRIDFTPAQRSWRDPRFGAVLALAPALGPGMEAASLAAIDVPVRLIAARDDEVLPFAAHAARYAAAIPGAGLQTLAAGGHFVFMPQCTFGAKVFTYFHRFDICGRRSNTDRAALRDEVRRQALEFFDAALRPGARQP